MKTRTRRWLWIASGAVAFYAVVGFLVLPPIARSQIEKRASAVLGRRVTVERVGLNPFAMSVTIGKLDIRTRDGRGSFLGWDRLYVNADALGSIFGAWRVSNVELDGFHAAVEIERDGSFSFADILQKVAPPAPAAAAPAPAAASRPAKVGRLAVRGARLEFTDLSRKLPFHTVIAPVEFNLSGLSTAGGNAPYLLSAVTESGEKVAATGTLCAAPVGSAGEFAVAGIVLPKYMPFVADLVQADLLGGRLSVRGRYELAPDPAKRVMRLAGGSVQLRGFRLAERGGTAAVVELPAVDVTGIDADAVALQAAVARVAVAGGRVAARRDADGSINLLKMLPAAPAQAAAPAAPAAPPLKASLGELAVSDFAVEVADFAVPRPAKLALGGVRVSLKNFSLADGAVMPLQAGFDWAPHGTVSVEGTVALKPQIKAGVKTVVSGFEILPLSPYIEQFVNARIARGSVSAAVEANAAVPEKGAPEVAASGGISVDNLELVDGVRSEALAGFEKLALSGLKASTAPPLALSLDEIAVARPYARVVVADDGSLNLAAVAGSPKLASPAPATGGAAAAPAAAPQLPIVEVGRIAIDGGDFSFADRSVRPGVRMAVTQFGGTITGLSSAHPGKGAVDLKMAVDGAGPIAVAGRFDPLAPRKFVDVKLDVKNVDLVPLSPYSGRFAGYELARGKLNVDVTAKLDGVKLDVANVVTVNQFTFGTATHSPDATSLPVRLGVALLKDIDGKIVIDMPVQGSLDDPNFRIGKVVWRVIANLLTKASTSPFSLLGSMFGGGGEELAYQEFAPGGSQLLAAGRPKLDTLVKALTNRPGLNLGIEGSYDRDADAYALRRQKLADLVRRKIWEERRATDPNIAPPEQLAITAEEHAAMLKKLFDEKFPPGTALGAPVAPPPAVSAPPPAPKLGLVRKVVRIVTFQAQREKRAAEAARARLDADHARAVEAAKATGLPVEEMAGRLAEKMEVTADDLQALADARARRVRDHLATEGKVSLERLFLSKPKAPEGAPAAGKGPRVFLELQ